MGLCHGVHTACAHLRKLHSYLSPVVPITCGDPFGCEPLMCSQKGSYCTPIGEAEEF